MSVIHEGDELKVRVECPHCSQVVDIETVLDGVLKVRAGKSTLSVACTAKTELHYCGQGTLPDPDTAGQVLEFLEDQGAVTPGVLAVDVETGEIGHEIAGRGVQLS